jgi:hypothetical protein
MMGERTVVQEALFYEFNLERHLPADHLLGQSIGLLTSPVSARTCGRFTVRSGVLRLIPSC